MQNNHSLLCGYSYAYQAGYKPTIFDTLEKLLLKEITGDEPFPDGLIKDIENKDLIEQIIDSYGKIGFLYFSLERINELKGEKMSSFPNAYYYAYNFIYDCKAFLDANAVMLNDHFNIGACGGEIDFKDGRFRSKVVKKVPKLSKTFNKHQKWIDEVVKWRKALIHRFSTPISCPGGQRSWHMCRDELDDSPLFPLIMIPDPRPYLSATYENRRNGVLWNYIEEVFQSWIDNARDFYEQLCSEIADDLMQSCS